jgi:hypothetical protein
LLVIKRIRRCVDRIAASSSSVVVSVAPLLNASSSRTRAELARAALFSSWTYRRGSLPDASSESATSAQAARQAAYGFHLLSLPQLSVAEFELPLGALSLLDQPPFPERPLGEVGHIRERGLRLHEVVEGARLHGLDGPGLIAMAGHDDDRIG